MANPPQEHACSIPALSAEGDRLTSHADDHAGLVSLMTNQYSNQRIEGLINFGVAENSLMHEDLKKFLPQSFTLDDLDFSYGDHLLGSTRLFKALANFFNKRFNPITPVEPGHILTGSGLTTIIEQLTTILCDPGDVFMIARPYYNGFDPDMTIRARAEVVGVDVGPDFSSPRTLDAFEAEHQRLTAAGKRVRAVMLCNPHNPLGFNYPRTTVRAYAAFCERHNLHLVADEVYALSQFANPDACTEHEKTFTSVLAVDVMKEAGCNPARVHVLYGMSKDFGANGLRVGCLVTQHNPALYSAFVGLGLQMKVSSVSDSLWSAILNDEKRLETFLATNQERLGEAFATCKAFLKKHAIPYLGQPVAALFFWINLSRFHRERDDSSQTLQTPFDKDMDLRKALANGGVYISPGHVYHGTEPGWFRFTFAVRPDFLKIGLERFEKVIEKWTAEALT